MKIPFYICLMFFLRFTSCMYPKLKPTTPVTAAALVPSRFTLTFITTSYRNKPCKHPNNLDLSLLMIPMEFWLFPGDHPICHKQLLLISSIGK